MPTIQRKARAEWKGDLKTGAGTVSSTSGALKAIPYDFKSRFEQGTHTNPEELIAAAHAACFSMALSNGLAKAGHVPTSVRTEATFTLDMTSGPKPTTIQLTTRGRVPGIDQATFQKFAEDAKANCPVSQALKAMQITLTATLET